MQDVFDFVDQLKENLSITLPSTFYTVAELRIEETLQSFIEKYLDSVYKMAKGITKDLDKIKADGGITNDLDVPRKASRN